MRFGVVISCLLSSSLFAICFTFLQDIRIERLSLAIPSVFWTELFGGMKSRRTNQRWYTFWTLQNVFPFFSDFRLTTSITTFWQCLISLLFYFEGVFFIEYKSEITNSVNVTHPWWSLLGKKDFRHATL